MLDAMNAPSIEAEPASSTDRLALTLCLAVLLHALVLFGIGFQSEPPPRPAVQSLDIVLVQSSDPAPVEEAELLANASRQGGGEVAPERAAVPVAPEIPSSRPEVVAAPPAPPAPAPRPPAPAAAAPPAPAPQPVLTAPVPASERAAEPESRQAETEPPRPATETAAAVPAEAAAPAPPPSASALIANSFNSASLDAPVAPRLNSGGSHPRRKFVSASTQEYKYAAYMEAWRAKVERIGNLNYPDEARRKQLSGSLILDVALRPDGSLAEIIVRRPSGHRVLDEAAMRIVELAAPYAPFPESFRDEVDVLHITRTWQFLNSQRFSGD